MFLAVDVPPHVVQAVQSVQLAIEAGAPGFYRWVGEEQAHLTLYFLGEIEQEERDRLTSALKSIQATKFEISVQGLALIPEKSSPRIIAAGIGGDVEALTRLQQRIADTVFPIATFKETRRYYPHVTMGRLKRGMPSNAKAVKRTLAEVKPPQAEPFVVEAFVLVKSELTDKGPNYETVERFPLS